MNSKTKRRMAVVTGIIVIVLIVVLAVVGGSNSAKSVSIADIADGSMNATGKNVQVTGNVLENSYATDSDGVLTFDIYDPDANSDQTLHVSYDGGVSATFGNDVVAICTGKMNEAGTLICSTLVTKCPSKYESGTDAFEVSQLLGYGSEVFDKPVKVTGAVKAGSLADATAEVRFVLTDASGASELSVLYAGALSDGIADGSTLVVTGSLDAAGSFKATDVALEG